MRAVNEHWHTWSRQVGWFAAIGAVNTVLGYLLYLLLHLFMPYWLAYAATFVAGVAFALVANARLFALAITPAGALAFCAFYLASFVVGLGIVVALVEGLQISTVLAPLGAVAVLLPINFFGSHIALRQGRRS
jgi:putative flippase GtrA